MDKIKNILLIAVVIFTTAGYASILGELENSFYGAVTVTKNKANTVAINADINGIDQRLKDLYIQIGKQVNIDLKRSKFISNDVIDLNRQVNDLLKDKSKLESSKKSLNK